MNPSAEVSARHLPETLPATPLVLWLAQRVPARLRRAGLAIGAGQVLLVLTGILILASAPFLGLSGDEWAALASISGGMAALVALSLACPWRRWSPLATIAFPLVGLAVLATFGLATEGLASAYVGAIPLWFLYLGIFHRAVVGALMVPPAWAAYAVMLGVFTPATIVRLVIYGAVWFAISGILAVLMSQQRLITAHLQVEINTDALTGLGNRRGLELRFADVSAGDCLVICDLDLFKSINDAFGHAAGDEVLSQFGTTIDQHMRRRDYAARYGGEEFVLVLVRTDALQAVAALESLRAEWLDLGAGVTFSAGIAVVTGNERPLDVLAAADAALYDAKAAGRDRFHVATRGSDAAALLARAPLSA